MGRVSLPEGRENGYLLGRPVASVGAAVLPSRRTCTLYITNLLRLRDSKVNQGATGAPARLGVIVPTGYAYVRDDGVAVIPIGTLGA